MSEPDCVAALIRDDRHRVLVHRRSASRRLFPGIWDLVGGHLEPGETATGALAREIEEETGWHLRSIDAVVADWRWEHEGRVRHEIDYLVQVDGDLAAPRLEEGKQDAFAWVGPDNLELMMVNRTDGDRRVLDIVARAVRTRFTPRLRMDPLGLASAEDLWRLHQDPGIQQWYGSWTKQYAAQRCAAYEAGWNADGIQKSMAYDRFTGELVGRGGASRMLLDGETRIELGWAVRQELWGRGYATEIGQNALDWIFGELDEPSVVAFTELHNARSRAVMERLGMRYTKDIELPQLNAGEPMDVPYALYVIDRSDWQARPQIVHSGR